MLSWRTETAITGWRQQAAELELVRSDGARQYAGIQGDASVGIEWPSAPMRAYDSVTVRVRVSGRDGSESGWSDPVVYRTGPLSGADWHADFIRAADDAGDDDFGVTRFRGEFVVAEGLQRALLSYTAQGAVVLEVDGRRVDDEELAPGWTQYDKRLAFSTVDVTQELAPGRHVLAATVGAGWFAERYGFNGQLVRTWHGPRALSSQLRLEYSDGEVATMTSDDTWSASLDGPTRRSSIYLGEAHDARLEDSWAVPGGIFRGGALAVVCVGGHGDLVPADRPPIRVIESLTPVAVHDRPEGPILDFGQNVVGRLRVRVRGAAGSKITLRHAEVLEGGELCLRLLRLADSTDTYVLAGNPAGEEWAPRFTYHGFRYAQVSGIAVEQLEVTAEVMHSDVKRIGWLETGNVAIDKLVEAIVWTFRGNLFSVPTDCTARDERLGWTGNYGFGLPAAAQLFDLAGFSESWMRDVSAVQCDNNDAPPPFVPQIKSVFPSGLAQAGWSDVATIVPSVLYRHYGSRPRLAEQYAGMQAWVERLRRESADGFWEAGRQLGDWLDPTSPPEHPEWSTTPTDFTSNAYFIWSLDMTAAAARELNRDADAELYSELAGTLRSEFRERYVLADGSISVQTQTALAVAIVFGLLDSDARAGSDLVGLVRQGKYRIGTGLIGTCFVADALTQAGYRQDAQRLVLNPDQPGWLAQISGGATTIWERWDSILPDGSINPGEMNSFNQYALGCIADWLLRDVGGITPLEPGYRRFLVRPRAGISARGRSVLRTPYGTVEVDWRARVPELGEASLLDLKVVVPPNTTATVDVPGVELYELGSGVHSPA